MGSARESREAQAALWNGAAGQAWVESQAMLDRVLAPIEDLLAAAVAEAGARRVLDVGCGTGATTLAAARRVGAGGSCLGVDVSAPMIDAARARVGRDGTPVAFVCADAQNHAFEPAAFDMVISRFGVMFFDDPVRAFANLRHAARDGADLCFVVWRGPGENPFMTTAERAAAPLLPDLPPRDPEAPGQFAFADAARVRRILEQGGWTDVGMRSVDFPCALPETALVPYLTRLGPVGRALREVDDTTRARVVETVRAAFEPYVHGDEVRFTAACWVATARAQQATDRPSAT